MRDFCSPASLQCGMLPGSCFQSSRWDGKTHLSSHPRRWRSMVSTFLPHLKNRGLISRLSESETSSYHSLKWACRRQHRYARSTTRPYTPPLTQLNPSARRSPNSALSAVAIVCLRRQLPSKSPALLSRSQCLRVDQLLRTRPSCSTIRRMMTSTNASTWLREARTA